MDSKLKKKCQQNISPQFIEIMRDVGNSAEKVGEQCKIVGGVVRDCLIGSQNDDLDFVCSDVDKVSSDLISQNKAKDVGTVSTERYKTKILIINHQKIDLVEPRKETYTKDSIKPIVEKGDFQTDALRRDFTINTLRIDVNPSKWFEIDDPTGKGLSDLKSKILRTPLLPDQTFTDDPTRMLRAVRFSACKNMTINDDVVQSIRKNKHQIQRIPSELIHKELMKGMVCPSYFDVMEQVDLISELFPEVDSLKKISQLKENHTDNAFIHSLKYTKYLPKDPIFQLVGLLHDVGKLETTDKEGHAYKHEQLSEKKTDEIMQRLKFSVNDIKRAKKLVGSHMVLHQLELNTISEKGLRRFIQKYDDILPELEIMSKADILSDHPHKKQALVELHQKIEMINHVKSKMNNVIGSEFKLAIDGNDIKQLGLQGKEIGIIKKALEQQVIDGELLNDRMVLLQEMKKMSNK
ncbi:MAG: HD domain-containing protein [Acidithiobacillus sp.]|jgi:tRNA nucleotidyltransferase/poly(A) polymerase|uniref:CCA tRNA nucleotidyltransferase n=1 Tax=Acidithiobacillus sp. TaxID=1872118 RepID=UPI00355F96BE